MKLVRLIMVLVLFTVAAGVVRQVEGAPTTLEKSLQLYKAGMYDSTILVIRNYLRRHGKDEQTLQLVPLVTEALVRRGEYVSAHRLFSMYRIKYPKSPFLARLWYLEGVALAKEMKYPEAITAFSTALTLGVSETLNSLIVANTEKICSHMATAEFN